MGLGTDHITLVEASNASRTRSNSAFVRELWADESAATYKANTVMSQLVVILPFTGQKGDTIHIPRPVRGSASAKVAENQVTLIATQATSSSIVINEHWEYSTVIEDIVKLQADDALRQFVTDDAGYALARRVDTALHNAGSRFAGAHASPFVAASTDYAKAVVGTPSAGALVAWDPSANANAGNASVLNDEGIRLMHKELDDNDVPSRQRYLVIPPVEKASSSAFRASRSRRSLARLVRITLSEPVALATCMVLRSTFRPSARRSPTPAPRLTSVPACSSSVRVSFWLSSSSPVRRASTSSNTSAT